MNQKYKYLKAAQANPDDSMLWDRYRIKGNWNMNQKYKYLKAAQANPDDSILWDRYRTKGNCIKRMLRIAEAQHWISQIEES